jgi:hypothetical protein
VTGDNYKRESRKFSGSVSIQSVQFNSSHFYVLQLILKWIAFFFWSKLMIEFNLDQNNITVNNWKYLKILIRICNLYFAVNRLRSDKLHRNGSSAQVKKTVICHFLK